MTSERLQEIMKEQEVDKYISVNVRFIVENCMKQAVNEALDEAAEKGKLSRVRVDILNLKVK